jgi:hypothetical protein
MTSHALTITPDVYFKPGIIVNENNVTTFRDLYRTLSKIEQFDGHEVDETSLLNAAQQLGIKADSDEYQEILRESVKYEDIEQTFWCVGIRIKGSVQQLSLSLPSTTAPPTQRSTSGSTAERPKEDKTPTILTEIECVLIIKQRGKEMDDFLRSHLLQIVKQTSIHE